MYKKLGRQPQVDLYYWNNSIQMYKKLGLGKTNLAQLVYNDQGVVSYFNLKMWVCVSDDFDVKVLVRNIIKSATNRDVENLELDQLQQLLKQNLDGKRYFLVLDDVWNCFWRQSQYLEVFGILTFLF